MRVLASFATLVAAVSAQSVIESSSFGYGQSISPSSDYLPGWLTGGEGHVPQILSDKLILTPPYPGNTRGFLWSQTPVSQSEWTAEFQFRASGPERAGGNLQLWYTKDGQDKIGTSSIYTVGQFDGFALVIDSHGGRGGSIRGFLNDGTTDYKSHRSVDSLAFGHCAYPYRNLGRPSILRVKYTQSVLEVTVDDKLCFQTPKVALPEGNTFGITGATPENPDSFEIFKFVVSSSSSGSSGSIPVLQESSQQGNNQQGSSQQPIVVRNAQEPVVQTTDSQATPQQLVDIGNRLQLVDQATNTLVRDVAGLASKFEDRHAEAMQQMATKDRVASIDARLQRIEQALAAIQRDLERKDYSSSFSQLHETLKTSHLSLHEALHDSLRNIITAASPRMGFFICMIIAFQLVLVISYVIYKRRRANMPKKFL
ncbi:hypothetical protein ASPZODRAFT_127299 [Penicilliopsis zonata CBS 506.65]|uniref:L-type lectin-like domain-containing protein n=1 Tax=Penicilliopsis zonata CBS 506.65 TaxID=1073090 RepID=A0A1L9SVY2_9EURO|nr:hypothetical protein ASPZODRAFT_127299 [Penicilliopsis zonata CBS 506.65]OJJ51261.1 hypothetical protein ASPZODRAFT_127299 [Penicilliopsis zonata CBS 506.65]